MSKSCQCRSTLADIAQAGYTHSALKRLTGGQLKLPVRVDFKRSDVIEARAEQVRQMSISGVQDKISVVLKRGRLSITDTGGMFILKPIPANMSLELQDQVPANEHLTMLLASQVYGVTAAACALIEMADGEPAYLTRRFDVIDLRADPTDRNNRRDMEDFCSLTGRSPETHGRNFKYDGSYEEIGRMLRQYCPAYRTEIEKLFRLILFNYLVSNGDAHQKNFSLYASLDGDMVLAPAYDLINTSLHLPNDARMALELFEDGYESSFFQANAFYGHEDFAELGRRFDMRRDRCMRIVGDMINEDRYQQAVDYVNRSFLADDAQERYISVLADRCLALRKQ